jgi:hypothetical protein
MKTITEEQRKKELNKLQERIDVLVRQKNYDAVKSVRRKIEYILSLPTKGDK